MTLAKLSCGSVKIVMQGFPISQAIASFIFMASMPENNLLYHLPLTLSRGELR